MVLRIVSILAVIVVYVVGDVKADWVASHYASVLVPAVALGIVPFVAKAAALSFGFGLGMAALVTWAMLGVSFAGVRLPLVPDHESELVAAKRADRGVQRLLQRHDLRGHVRRRAQAAGACGHGRS